MFAHSVSLTLVFRNIGVDEADNVRADGGKENLREGGLLGGLSGLTRENRNLGTGSHGDRKGEKRKEKTSAAFVTKMTSSYTKHFEPQAGSNTGSISKKAEKRHPLDICLILLSFSQRSKDFTQTQLSLFTHSFFFMDSNRYNWDDEDLGIQESGFWGELSQFHQQVFLRSADFDDDPDVVERISPRFSPNRVSPPKTGSYSPPYRFSPPPTRVSPTSSTRFSSPPPSGSASRKNSPKNSSPKKNPVFEPDAKTMSLNHHSSTWLEAGFTPACPEDYRPWSEASNVHPEHSHSPYSQGNFGREPSPSTQDEFRFGFRQPYPDQDRQVEPDDYLSQGLREVGDALSFHFRGKQFPKHVAIRAKELFQKSHEIQLQQKAGDVAFKKHRRSSNNTSHRVRYGRRKAFVITAIVVALKEFGVSLQGRVRMSDKDTISLLSDSVPGNSTVSIGSVKSCCRDLCLDDRIRFR